MSADHTVSVPQQQSERPDDHQDVEDRLLPRRPDRDRLESADARDPVLPKPGDVQCGNPAVDELACGVLYASDGPVLERCRIRQ